MILNSFPCSAWERTARTLRVRGMWVTEDYAGNGRGASGQCVTTQSVVTRVPLYTRVLHYDASVDFRPSLTRIMT